jgi:hypothetical protein
MGQVPHAPDKHKVWLELRQQALKDMQVMLFPLPAASEEDQTMAQRCQLHL